MSIPFYPSLCLLSGSEQLFPPFSLFCQLSPARNLLIIPVLTFLLSIVYYSYWQLSSPFLPVSIASLPVNFSSSLPPFMYTPTPLSLYWHTTVHVLNSIYAALLTVFDTFVSLFRSFLPLSLINSCATLFHPLPPRSIFFPSLSFSFLLSSYHLCQLSSTLLHLVPSSSTFLVTLVSQSSSTSYLFTALPPPLW